MRHTDIQETIGYARNLHADNGSFTERELIAILQATGLTYCKADSVAFLAVRSLEEGGEIECSRSGYGGRVYVFCTVKA